MLMDAHTPATVWETIATTRWGQYTTEVVEEAIKTGTAMAGPPGSALEVGCEGGRWSRLLASAGWATTCTDIDPNVLAVCQGRVPTANCVLVSPDDTTLPCATGSMNLVLCLEVFPVMDSPWFAAEASRVLAEGGVLIGVAHNRMSLRGMFVRAKQYLTVGSHEFYNVSYAEWRRRTQDAGFGISFERGYCWFPLGRESNSRLAPFFIALERWLGLSRLTALSPWIVFIARKRAHTISQSIV
jgi:SAM-dependent methyltransferase